MTWSSIEHFDHLLTIYYISCGYKFIVMVKYIWWQIQTYEVYIIKLIIKLLVKYYKVWILIWMRNLYKWKEGLESSTFSLAPKGGISVWNQKSNEYVFHCVIDSILL
jgi:hypothetical protein